MTADEFRAEHLKRLNQLAGDLAIADLFGNCPAMPLPGDTVHATRKAAGK